MCTFTRFTFALCLPKYVPMHGINTLLFATRACTDTAYRVHKDYQRALLQLLLLLMKCVLLQQDQLEPEGGDLSLHSWEVSLSKHNFMSF